MKRLLAGNSVILPVKEEIAGLGTSPVLESKDLQATGLSLGWNPPYTLSLGDIVIRQAAIVSSTRVHRLKGGDGFTSDVLRKAGKRSLVEYKGSSNSTVTFGETVGWVHLGELCCGHI